MRFPNSRVFREILRVYVMRMHVNIKFKLNKKTKNICLLQELV
jgi:hypothetical protein